MQPYDRDVRRKGAIVDLKACKWPIVRLQCESSSSSCDGEEFVYSVSATLFDRLPDSDGLVNYLREPQP